MAARNLSKAFGGADFGEQVHAIGDGQKPTVYQTGHVVRWSEGGTPTIMSGIEMPAFLSLLEEGLNVTQGAASDAAIDPKLRTALDLYRSHHYESSSTSRLLTLIMVLETLRSGAEKHKVALDILERWQVELEGCKINYDPDSQEHESLESLERELFFRRETSLRSQIRRLVRETLEADGNPDAVQLAKRAVEIYDLRSKLVHEGNLPGEQLTMAGQDAKEIARLVLRARLRAS